MTISDSLDEPSTSPRSRPDAVHPTPLGADGSFGLRLYDRGVQRAANILLLLLVSPLALAIGLPIIMINAVLFRSVRRAFYVQPRIGLGGEVFDIWKFRTMRSLETGEDYRSWKLGEDGLRVTFFGRLLRNTHLDELPQLFNVFLGNMAIVGPRPEMVEIHRWAEEHIPHFADRNVVRPGITGLAQVSQGYTGPDEEAYEDKFRTDMEYVHGRCLWLDTRIVLRTVAWMVSGKGWRCSASEQSDRPREDSLPRLSMMPHTPPSSSAPTGEAAGIEATRQAVRSTEAFSARAE